MQVYQEYDEFDTSNSVHDIGQQNRALFVQLGDQLAVQYMSRDGE